MLAVTVALVTEQCHAGPLGDLSWSPPRSNLQFTTWSPPITNSQTGVAYRFGVTETETHLPVSWTSLPLIIEIVNTGTNARQWVCFSPAAGEQVSRRVYGLASISRSRCLSATTWPFSSAMILSRFFLPRSPGTSALRLS